MSIAVLLLALSTAGCEKTDESGGGETKAAEPAKPEPKPSSATESAAEPPAAMGNDMMASMRETCPMAVDGVSVVAADTDAGASLTFELEDGDVAELRRRVQHMAQMYTTHAGHGGMMWHAMGGPSGGGMHGGGMHGGGMDGKGMMHGKGGPMPPAEAAVEETDHGARITFTPKDVSQMDALREHVRMHQARMGSGECWMATPAKDEAPQ